MPTAKGWTRAFDEPIPLPDGGAAFRTAMAGYEIETHQAVERAIAHHEATRGLKSKLDVARVRIGTLTPRERQVFELVVRRKTNKHVANALGSTERTIKAHRHRVMEKMQVRSLAELVSVSERVGVLGASGNGSRPGQSIN